MLARTLVDRIWAVALHHDRSGNRLDRHIVDARSPDSCPDAMRVCLLDAHSARRPVCVPARPQCGREQRTQSARNQLARMSGVTSASLKMSVFNCTFTGGEREVPGKEEVPEEPGNLRHATARGDGPRHLHANHGSGCQSREEGLLCIDFSTRTICSRRNSSITDIAMNRPPSPMSGMRHCCGAMIASNTGMTARIDATSQASRRYHGSEAASDCSPRCPPPPFGFDATFSRRPTSGATEFGATS